MKDQDKFRTKKKIGKAYQESGGVNLPIVFGFFEFQKFVRQDQEEQNSPKSTTEIED